MNYLMDKHCIFHGTLTQTDGKCKTDLLMKENIVEEFKNSRLLKLHC